MVQAENGTCVLKGLKTGTIYNIDFYASDVAGAPCTFSPNGKAGSSNNNFWKVPEDCVLVDISIATGLTATVGVQVTSNDAPIRNASLRLANYLNTLTTRPGIRVGIAKGNNFGLMQY